MNPRPWQLTWFWLVPTLGFAFVVYRELGWLGPSLSLIVGIALIGWVKYRPRR